MGQTPTYRWPYPEADNSPDGPVQIKALADAADQTVTGVDGRLTGFAQRLSNVETLVANGNPHSSGFWVGNSPVGQAAAILDLTMTSIHVGQYDPGRRALIINQTGWYHVNIGITASGVINNVSNLMLTKLGTAPADVMWYAPPTMSSAGSTRIPTSGSMSRVRTLTAGDAWQLTTRSDNGNFNITAAWIDVVRLGP